MFGIDRELYEGRAVGRLHSALPRRWLTMEQTTLAQHASPDVEVGLTEAVALTERTDGELGLVPATHEVEPVLLLAGIGLSGHGRQTTTPCKV